MAIFLHHPVHLSTLMVVVCILLFDLPITSEDLFIGSFHARALAVTAAHRFNSSSSPQSHYSHSQSPNNQTSPIPISSDPTPGLSPLPSQPSSLNSNASSQSHSSQSPKYNTDSSRLHGFRSRKQKDGSGSASIEESYHWLSGGTGVGGGTGDEPGVDVRSKRDEESYRHLNGRCHISVSTGCVSDTTHRFLYLPGPIHHHQE